MKDATGTGRVAADSIAEGKAEPVSSRASESSVFKVQIKRRLRDLDPYIAVEIEKTARLDAPLWERVLATFVDLPHDQRGQHLLPDELRERLLDALPPNSRGRGLLVYREAMIGMLNGGATPNLHALREEIDRCGLSEWRLLWPDQKHEQPGRGGQWRRG